MKRILVKFLLIAVIIISAVFVFNMSVTTQQGINYQWHSVKMPLYLKILDFFDRHCNYNQLVKNIVKDTKTEEERVMKIFEWTYKNIREVPEGMPIIDDHVWYIIVRGYGVGDQFSDVFTTLCNYAGIEAFYSWVYSEDQAQRIPLSFVKIKGNWFIFDPYRGVYFEDREGRLSSIKVLISGMDWKIESQSGQIDIDYATYFVNLPSLGKIGLTRATIQSPWRRLMFEVRKWRKKN